MANKSVGEVHAALREANIPVSGVATIDQTYGPATIFIAGGNVLRVDWTRTPTDSEVEAARTIVGNAFDPPGDVAQVIHTKAEKA